MSNLKKILRQVKIVATITDINENKVYESLMSVVLVEVIVYM